MKDQSLTLLQEMSPTTHSDIGSLVLGAGGSPSASPAGKIRGRSSLDRPRASRSLKQANAEVRTTRGIYGPTCFESNVNFDASGGLASRLAARLATVGSMEFVLTWKRKATPLKRLIYRLAASRPHISDRESTGSLSAFPTAKASDGGLDLTKSSRSVTGLALPAVVVEMMVGYPTPNAHPDAPNMSKTRENGRIANRETEQCLGEVAKQLDLIAFRTPSASDALLVAHPNPDAQAGQHSLATEATMLSSWASPSARDHKDTPGMATRAENPDGSERDRTDQLPRQVAGVVSAWQTPGTDSFRSRGGDRKDEMGLDQQAHAAAEASLSARPTARAEDSECCGNHPGAMDSLTGVTRVLSGQTSPSSDQIPKGNTDVLADGSKPLKKSPKGALSPTFVSWLMGYPSAWLECAPEKIVKPRKDGARRARTRPAESQPSTLGAAAG